MSETQFVREVWSSADADPGTSASIPGVPAVEATAELDVSRLEREVESRALERPPAAVPGERVVCLGIISQRPSKIGQDVLSQCGTRISMQIQNPNDQDAIKSSVEAAGEDVLRELPGLTPGQAVVSGDAMNTPALIQVRQRRTPHGAGSRPVIDND